MRTELKRILLLTTIVVVAGGCGKHCPKDVERIGLELLIVTASCYHNAGNTCPDSGIGGSCNGGNTCSNYYGFGTTDCIGHFDHVPCPLVSYTGTRLGSCRTLGEELIYYPKNATCTDAESCKAACDLRGGLFTR